MTPEFIGPFWKSSYTAGEGQCVEVALTSTGGRAIRDSKNPHGPLLHLSPTGWQAFLDATKDSARVE
ncbi:DUF397 domain-containing protein [Streptomyces scabiei]|uniref:DUF397 domain-containing protein n=1 Tax=Streptomyces scabiei TaxID=1930 RepID=UPI0007744362|nr:DUF397 domain-containing protein [Streptomyces scabiei]MDX3204001.1 DUF397 domain-containing protein [Streptomyces scabiei]MDX3218644.1 DUF397 domain-containing protein [Streptomyces scabiei]